MRGVMVGRDQVVDLCLTTLLAGGHVLLTDVPGVGKTTLARAVAVSIRPTSLSGLYLAVVYATRRISSHEPGTHLPVSVWDARIYSCHKEHARRAAATIGEPGTARLGEIYPQARFRDAVPAALAEEFDQPELEVLAAGNRFQRSTTLAEG